MRSGLRFAYRLLVAAGFDPLRTYRFARGVPRYIRDWRRFSGLSGSSAGFRNANMYPCIGDANAEGGTARGHYFHQDLLVAQRIFAARPRRHLDVGSRVDGFVAHVASFRRIEVCDVRRTDVDVKNIAFRQLDVSGDLPQDLLGCCDSLSCLHAIEHIGLGRYGDTLDPHGHCKAIGNLSAILESGGVLYLSAPIGPQRIEFNAHRVFSAETLLALVEPTFEVRFFSFVDDQGRLFMNVDLTADAVNDNFGCFYGCAILELSRR